MKIFSFIAQAFQDADGKTSSTRIIGFTAMFLFCFCVYQNVMHGRTVSDMIWFNITGLICASFGFKIWNEQNKQPDTNADNKTS